MLKIEERGLMLSDYFSGTAGVMLSLFVDNHTTKKEILTALEDEINNVWDHIQYTFPDYSNEELDQKIDSELLKMREYIRGHEEEVPFSNIEEIKEDILCDEYPVLIFTIEEEA